jgi:hypothetical protein
MFLLKAQFLTKMKELLTSIRPANRVSFAIQRY